MINLEYAVLTFCTPERETGYLQEIGIFGSFEEAEAFITREEDTLLEEGTSAHIEVRRSGW